MRKMTETTAMEALQRNGIKCELEYDAEGNVVRKAIIRPHTTGLKNWGYMDCLINHFKWVMV
jgi:YD repeat-containing protein